MQEQQIGPLKCRIVGNPKVAKLTAVFCHGYGAPGTDLVQLAPEILGLDERLDGQVAFVFPEAPLSLAELGMPGGRAWWEINMMRLQQLLQTRQIEKLVMAEPPGLKEARELFQKFLEALQSEYDLTMDRLILGGFSQGAMLTTDFFLRTSDQPAGLCLYSGTTICLEDWQKLAQKKTKLPILQSHGTQDPILPYEAAVLLKDLLNENGQEVEFLPFQGPHTIPYEALERTVKMLVELLVHK
ncbi:hypothetical protein [Rubinisphaera sp.]|uniref:alpha/beta hydrolase n=1 Tax=Rubinisphaera sp. TaxID=2024857 RepID=UPI000C0E1F22|nr:hypothetical protein [Rubinisphaera sp.]MBV09036.1 phospholipase [Rubinisphaera sp.]HCS53229.1 phospholipase [Planctomycetaceae bacterium]|tara:strand:+ start:20692 stop:21417 length:726 start_codon:yes stop_codon:yes gene_type:complete